MVLFKETIWRASLQLKNANENIFNLFSYSLLEVKDFIVFCSVYYIHLFIFY